MERKFGVAKHFLGVHASCGLGLDFELGEDQYDVRYAFF